MFLLFDRHTKTAKNASNSNVINCFRTFRAEHLIEMVEFYFLCVHQINGHFAIDFSNTFWALGLMVWHNFLWWTFFWQYFFRARVSVCLCSSCHLFCSCFTVKNKEFVIDAVDWKITKRFREGTNNENNEREKNYFIAIVCQVVCFIGTKRTGCWSSNNNNNWKIHMGR